MIVFGEHVRYFNRDAVVVCTSPYILKMLDFHSYVPLTNMDNATSTGCVDEATTPVPNGVRQRIVDYLLKFHQPVEPTGSENTP